MTQIISDKTGKPVQATTAWIIAVVTFGYMLPWAIAATRGKSNAGAVGWINLLLGWTGIGWIIALVMACGSHQAVAFQPQYVPPVPAPVVPVPPVVSQQAAPVTAVQGDPLAPTPDGLGHVPPRPAPPS